MKKNNKKYICIDGNAATARIGYVFSDVVCIYPITPSSPMAELNDNMANIGKVNIFGNKVKVIQMQSESGVAGALHGNLLAGALSTTYTCSQGLLLMIPDMYRIAGEHLPCVFHISSRSIATHALNIFCDHSDVMSIRQTGFCMLCSNNPQESMDLAVIAHTSSLKSSLPFAHFFDGFRTSHEINKIENVDFKTINKMTPFKEINIFRKRAHNPQNPIQTGTTQNPDTFFQNREASNNDYECVYSIVKNEMEKFGHLTGRNYKPFIYIGDKNATHLIVSMGSSCDTIHETIKYLNDKKFALLKIHLYRPFNSKEFVKLIPNSIKYITVLDRTKESGSVGEPLFIDVCSSLNKFDKKNIKVFSCRYGIGGKDFTPDNVISILNNPFSKNKKQYFTVGINDDVSNLSLNINNKSIYPENNTKQYLFYGLGGDGTISASKSTIKIIGKNTNKFVQGYFEYDSKKSGSLTVSHLRISDSNIKLPYLIRAADFISINNYSFVHKYNNLINNLSKNSIVLINTNLSPEQLARDLPEQFKLFLKKQKSRLFIIPANKIALKLGLSNKINLIMQSCFFKLTNIIDYDLARKEMKDFAFNSYSKKGLNCLKSNCESINAISNYLIEIKIDFLLKVKSIPFTNNKNVSKYFQEFAKPILKREGNNLPVSAFNKTGSVPLGTSIYQKKDIAQNIPIWKPNVCTQCGICTLVCPHAALQAYLLENKTKLPISLSTKPAIGIPKYNFVLQVSPLDCTGCGACVNACPIKEKGLKFEPIQNSKNNQVINYNFVSNHKSNRYINFDKPTTKHLQFVEPYFKYPDACPGCGEATYIKILTQLFGKNMIIANATGCSSIYGGSEPICPFTKDDNGHGPSWANSLFENNAEFGYGIYTGINYRRNLIFNMLHDLSKFNISKELLSCIYLLTKNKNNIQTDKIANKLINLLNIEKNKKSKSNILINKILNNKDLLFKKSIWIIGGDGWAYDIGFGGLDHVISTGENVNILILDTEVYSNTGGQVSKSTPLGATAKFASNGKITSKKDLGLIAMTYKNVYVASVSLGANYQQLINSLIEAESYDGPSIVICYSPCNEHGMSSYAATPIEQKKAVLSGYWNLYRYDPRKKNPLTLDPPYQSIKIEEFLSKESRFNVLLNKNSIQRSKLLNQIKTNISDKKRILEKIAKNNNL